MKNHFQLKCELKKKKGKGGARRQVVLRNGYRMEATERERGRTVGGGLGVHSFLPSLYKVS